MFLLAMRMHVIEYLSASQTQEGIDEEAISNEIGPIGPSDLPIDLSSPISFSQCYGLPELTEKRYIIIVFVVFCSILLLIS